MPLLDHFHLPLRGQRHWESFHALWTAALVTKLNQTALPSNCFAEAQVHVGSRVEVDVGAFEQQQAVSVGLGDGNNGGVALQTWAPPTATVVLPAVFPDEIEVQVFHQSGGATLVGVVELISPGNKDRPETRRAFAAKCASYLQQGIGLVIVDIVTERQSNLHNELVRVLEQPARFEFGDELVLYAVAYQPSRRSGEDRIDAGLYPLALGKPLMIVPLALRGIGTVPVDLETTYMSACRASRL
jgi:hypothetical protein